MFGAVDLVVNLTGPVFNLRPLTISEQRNITRIGDQWLSGDSPFRQRFTQGRNNKTGAVNIPETCPANISHIFPVTIFKYTGLAFFRLTGNVRGISRQTRACRNSHKNGADINAIDVVLIKPDGLRAMRKFK